MKLKLSILLFFIFVCSLSVYSQSEDKSENWLKDHFWYGVNVGNIGINNNFFTAGVAPMAGLKFNKSLGFGLIGKFNYTYAWQAGGQNFHFF